MQVSDEVVVVLLGLIEFAQDSDRATPEQFEDVEGLLRGWLRSADPSSTLADDVRRVLREVTEEPPSPIRQAYVGRDRVGRWTRVPEVWH